MPVPPGSRVVRTGMPRDSSVFASHGRCVLLPAPSSPSSVMNLPRIAPPRTLILVDCTIVLLVALRSEEHTSELQSQSNLVCRLLLEKKKKINKKITHSY